MCALPIYAEDQTSGGGERLAGGGDDLGFRAFDEDRRLSPVGQRDDGADGGRAGGVDRGYGRDRGGRWGGGGDDRADLVARFGEDVDPGGGHQGRVVSHACDGGLDGDEAFGDAADGAIGGDGGDGRFAGAVLEAQAGNGFAGGVEGGGGELRGIAGGEGCGAELERHGGGHNVQQGGGGGAGGGGGDADLRVAGSPAGDPAGGGGGGRGAGGRRRAAGAEFGWQAGQGAGRRPGEPPHQADQGVRRGHEHRSLTVAALLDAEEQRSLTAAALLGAAPIGKVRTRFYGIGSNS